MQTTVKLFLHLQKTVNHNFQWCSTRGRSRTPGTSMMELFLTFVNS